MKKYRWLNIITIFTIVFSLFSPFAASKVAVAEELNMNANSIQLLPVELQDGAVKLTWISHLNEEVQLSGFELVKNGDSTPIVVNEVDSKTVGNLVTTTYTYTDGEVQAGETITYQVNGLAEQTIGSNVQEISIPIEEEDSETPEENTQVVDSEQQAIVEEDSTESETVEQEEATTDVTETEDDNSSEQEAAVEFEDYYLERQIRSYLSLSEDEPITKEGLSTLTNLFALDSQVESLVGLEHAVNLTSITMAENHITDISPLSGLKKLEYLDLENNDISSIDALKDLNLQTLLLSNNPITTIDALSGMSNLTYLYLEGTEIESIEQLERLEGLQELYIRNIPTLAVSEDSDAYNVIQTLLDRYVMVDFEHLDSDNPTPEPDGDIVAFEDENLEALVRDVLGVYDRDVYATDMETLETLSLSYSQIRDLTGLEYASNLIHLYIYGNEITDITPLKGLTKLVHLDMEINNVSDISPLKNLTELETLWIDQNPIEDISVLSNLPNLTTLYLHETNISSIDTLLDVPSLQYVTLYYNNLSFTEDSHEYTVIRELISRGVTVEYLIGGYDYSFDLGQVTSDSISLSWNVNGEDVTSYIVYLDGVNITTTENNAYTFEGLTPETEYRISIELLNAEGEVVDVMETYVSTEVELGEVVTFGDVRVEEAVRNELGIYEGDLYQHDLKQLYYLHIADLSVSDLSGLEYAVNLQDLSAWNNSITDLSALKDLTHLRYLELSDNQITNIEDLSGLENLDTLTLDSNPISDLSELEGLGQLRFLSFNQTEVEDISLLLKLENLENVWMRDISAAITGNAYEVVQELIKKNVYVDYTDPYEDFPIWINTKSDHSLNLTWNLYNEDKLDKFAIYLDGEKIEETHNWSYQFTNLEANKTYEIRIDALDENGEVLTSHPLLITTDEEPSGIVINFPDGNLKQAIMEQLGIYGRDVYESDMEKLQSFNIYYNYDIEDLTGLEYAKNLYSISIYDSNISNLEPLSNLTSLEYIDIVNSKVTDLSPLSELTELRALWLNGNPIKDIQPLASLDQLNSLVLHDTEISDLSTLLELDSLNWVTVYGTSIDLSAESDDMLVIKELQEKGVKVEYEYHSLYIDYSNVTESSALITWEYSTDVDRLFEYEISINNIEEPIKLDKETTSYELTDLKPQTYYEVQLKALDEEGNELTNVGQGIYTLGEPTGEKVQFEDENLENAVKNYIGITHRDLYSSDLEIIESISLSYEGITDLTGLEYAVNLQYLYLGNNEISNLEPIQHLVNLQELYLEDNNIEDISVVGNLQKLEWLSIGGNAITSIEEIASLNNLSYLHLYNTKLVDINVLAELQNLIEVDLNGIDTLDYSEGSEDRDVIVNLLERGVDVYYNYDSYIDVELEEVTDNSIDISWSFDSLEPVAEYVIYLNGAEVTRGQDLSTYLFENLLPSTEYNVEVAALDDDGYVMTSHTYYITTNEPSASGEVVTFTDENLEAAIRDTLYIYNRDIMTSDMENLTYLYAGNGEISDLTGLENATNLIELNLAYNNITSIKVLQELTTLESLTLWGNEVEDLSPLTGLTNLTYLDLDDAAVQSVDALQNLVNLETLYLSSNKIEDITPLQGLINLMYLSLSDNPLNLKEGSDSLETLNTLINQGTYVSHDQEVDLIDRYFFGNEVTDTTATIEWGIDLTDEEIAKVGVYVNDEYIELPAQAYASYTIEDLAPNLMYDVILEIVDHDGTTYTAYTTVQTARSAEELAATSFKATTGSDEDDLSGLEFTIEGIEASNDDVFYYGDLTKAGLFRNGYCSVTNFNIPYGTYEVIVHGRGMIQSTITQVDITKDSTNPILIELEKIEKETGPTTINVVNEDGEPITELEYLSLYSKSVTQAFNYEYGSYYEWGIGNEKGEYLFEDFVYADDYYISIGAETYKPYNGEVTINKENNEVTITIEQGSRVELEVVDAENGSSLGATYYVYGNNSYAYGEVDAGNYIIGGLETEDLTVEISMPGYQTAEFEVKAEDFENGLASLSTVELQKEKFIEGKLFKADHVTPADYVYVYLYQDGQYAGWTRTDATGYFKVRNIQDGTYTLKTESYNQPNIEEEVTTGEYYTFYLEEKQEGNFTGDGNTFASSTKTVVPGKSIKYRFNFKNNGDVTADEAKVNFELPEGVTLNKESVLVNGEPYAFNKGITLSDISAGETGEISFEAEVNDAYVGQVVSANAVLTANGKDFVTSASTNVLFVTINAPEKTATSTLKVYGEAKSGDNVKVEIYDGAVKLATTTVSGRWWYADVSLPVIKGEASTHELYAKIIDGDTTNVTEPVKVSYEPSIPKIEDVTIQAGWNKDIKPNPYTGLATFAIVEFTQIDFEVKFDKQIEHAKIYFIGEEYDLTSEDGVTFEGHIPSTWSSYGEQLMEIEFDGIKLPLMEVIVLIDPSGFVFEGSLDNKLSGVTAVVEEKEDNRWKNWNAHDFGQINPQVTKEDGKYGWDVPQGEWRVIFSKDGYNTYTSRIVTVPPPETELNVPLIRTDDPIVTAVTPDNEGNNVAVDSKVRVVFDRLMDQQNLAENIQVINSSTGETVEGEFTFQNLAGYKKSLRADGYHDYVEDTSKRLSSWFEFTPEQTLDPSTTYQVVVKGEIADYDGKAIGEDYVTMFTTVEVETPDNGEEPGDGETPDNGEEPGSGETPGNGEEPGDGETPGNGEEPGNGETPGNGEEPGNGETPDNGEEPGSGETPDNGEEPGNGETPDNGEEPGDGERPNNGEEPGNGETPTNGDTPVSNETSNKDRVQNKDEQTSNSDQQAKKDDEEANELPNTGTNMFNLLLIGLVIILLGGSGFFIAQRRKKA
ncbi:leucine-rich repeat domain-containing protein [Metabacillus halosaccharovorans]|uniref:leucine-rich repeat domain-containing protein n=1 Tax=Metabacillus halosaccharovorans TaxID=930124 RepID=UPI0020412B3D|nr:leucine-rich repeat domain-containing protein [Metabacillus halosaccharovorans]MCM3443795.1 leucine-rich repeat domain-containing protein [Metabacillus halosaccharovorans]